MSNQYQINYTQLQKFLSENSLFTINIFNNLQKDFDIEISFVQTELTYLHQGFCFEKVNDFNMFLNAIYSKIKWTETLFDLTELFTYLVNSDNLYVKIVKDRVFIVELNYHSLEDKVLHQFSNVSELLEYIKA